MTIQLSLLLVQGHVWSTFSIFYAWTENRCHQETTRSSNSNSNFGFWKYHPAWRQEDSETEMNRNCFPLCILLRKVWLLIQQGCWLATIVIKKVSCLSDFQQHRKLLKIQLRLPPPQSHLTAWRRHIYCLLSKWGLYVHIICKLFLSFGKSSVCAPTVANQPKKKEKNLFYWLFNHKCTYSSDL